jgi:hypothetical protein
MFRWITKFRFILKLLSGLREFIIKNLEMSMLGREEGEGGGREREEGGRRRGRGNFPLVYEISVYFEITFRALRIY